MNRKSAQPPFTVSLLSLNPQVHEGMRRERSLARLPVGPPCVGAPLAQLTVHFWKEDIGQSDLHLDPEGLSLCVSPVEGIHAKATLCLLKRTVQREINLAFIFDHGLPPVVSANLRVLPSPAPAPLLSPPLLLRLYKKGKVRRTISCNFRGATKEVSELSRPRRICAIWVVVAFLDILESDFIRGSSHQPPWITLSTRMKAVSLALLYLGSVSFFGVEAAKLDLASSFKRKWAQWEQRRARRDIAFPAATRTGPSAADASLLSLIRTQDVKDEPGMAQPSRPEDDRHIRVKRYRQNSNSFSLRLGCRLGTCNTQNLAHMIYHLTDKDKDSAPPASKLSAHGYGRRRRALSDRRGPAVSGGARTLSRLLRSLPAARSPSAPAQARQGHRGPVARQ